MADLHLNQDPAGKPAIMRHLKRIQRLKLAKGKAKYSGSRDKFQDEITRRILFLKTMDITVPDSDNGLADLVSRVDSSTSGRV